MRSNFLNIPLADLLIEQPIYNDFFMSFNINAMNEPMSFNALIKQLPQQFWDDHAMQTNEFAQLFLDYVEGLESAADIAQINSLEVLAGNNKSGEAESCNLIIKPGEITCIVGPTGSGKSRLLADIEWLANADTPTKRKVLINENTVDESFIRNMGGKLIAQITQNMNFVLDMNVNDFLLLHAQSRFLENANEKVKEVIALANELSGETFDPQTPVTFLSGGQSRALMIADVACIGQAPIVLIDEIENAGVDKKKALNLLVSQDKIVLMATHDPLLILQADKRVVIKNGGMHQVIFTTPAEKEFLKKLEQIDATMQKSRNFFRLGNQLLRPDDLLLN